MKSKLLLCLTGFLPLFAQAGSVTSADLKEYRNLALKIRSKGTFSVPVPNRGSFSFRYEMKLGQPLYEEPLTSDFYLSSEMDRFTRDFWDRIFLEDGSFIELDGEKVPLTCIFVQGHDNRYSKKDTPLLPDLSLKVFLVANDFTCTGPINPEWPKNGLKKETWDTYLYFEVRDPTIMLPSEIKLRQRWEEYSAFMIDNGGT